MVPSFLYIFSTCASRWCGWLAPKSISSNFKHFLTLSLSSERLSLCSPIFTPWRGKWCAFSSQGNYPVRPCSFMLIWILTTQSFAHTQAGNDSDRDMLIWILTTRNFAHTQEGSDSDRDMLIWILTTQSFAHTQEGSDRDRDMLIWILTTRSFTHTQAGNDSDRDMLIWILTTRNFAHTQAGNDRGGDQVKKHRRRKKGAVGVRGGGVQQRLKRMAKLGWNRVPLYQMPCFPMCDHYLQRPRNCRPLWTTFLIHVIFLLIKFVQFMSIYWVITNNNALWRSFYMFLN